MFNKFTTAGLNFPAQGSATFNGSSDYIQLNTPFSYTNHTIAAWVYANDTANNKVIFDNRDVNDDGIGIYLDGSEQVYYLLNTSDLGPFSVTADDWVFMTATYDGTTQKFYIDGSLSGSQAASQTISVSSDSTIGAQNVPKSNYYSGNLANVAIWNRALSSDEINSVMWKSYEALSGAESNGLQAWYSLDDITSPAASLANMEQLAADKDATIENKAAITAAINALS
jgi:hypothetical protein